MEFGSSMRDGERAIECSVRKNRTSFSESQRGAQRDGKRAIECSVSKKGKFILRKREEKECSE